MLIYIDIDETICQTPPSRDYSKAIPNIENIKRMNELYTKGHTIVYWTARGTVSKIDFQELTEEQFQEWGVKYHELKFGKPAFDLFIDDKVLNSLYHLEDLHKFLPDFNSDNL